jgi:5-methylcytosine-specific restriction endonuclease McrA
MTAQLCLICEMRPPRRPGRVLCDLCAGSPKARIAYRIRSENKRAITLENEGTLTYQEWMRICNHFCVPDPESGEYCYTLTCAYCGEPISPYWATIEHWTPVSVGGGTTRWNTIPSCASCNFMKGMLDGDTFFGELINRYHSPNAQENLERVYRWFERMDAVFEGYDIRRHQEIHRHEAYDRFGIYLNSD